jgi:hypothetical protein
MTDASGLPAGILSKLEALAAAGIDLVPMPSLERHFVFTRDGFASLVERRPDGFGRIGAAGKVTDHGLAMLVWQGERGSFVCKDFSEPATDSEVEEIRRFSADLALALGGQ